MRPNNDLELEEALSELLQSAYENGIDPEGGWVVQGDSDEPDWDIHITKVQRTPTDES